MADDFKNVTVQLTPDLLEKIDLRAKALDLNRSQYIRRIARLDIAEFEKEMSHVEQSTAPAAPAAQPMERAA